MPLLRRSILWGSLRMLDHYKHLCLHMWADMLHLMDAQADLKQMIPADIKWDPNATPPQFTDNEESVIQVGTHIRVKIMGTRAEVGNMFAIASIKEDYLGYAAHNDLD